ncbi:tRNA preQ1(34) S-adenosylmethionine ribosyltransferase-isomerase QueA [Candidatus Parcubacteria bacterium]|jgi:S-adenosylmethionine:tRNA ribosyltransferase-isomerase|nr:MAG: tRNA preQ1(34) S-adenosylmethionine ribosyltransferase-isomerase QueA [Candidatus Parcubacteria bacterium]
MKNLKAILRLYDYKIPKSLIAQKLAQPRDQARLLIYERKTKKIKLDRFNNLPEYLPENSVLVFNQTKVLPARLILQKPTGGKIKILYLKKNRRYIWALCENRLVIGEKYTLTPRIQFQLVKKINNHYVFKSTFPISQLETILMRFGVAPLPPYLKKSPLTEAQKKAQYQTVFANVPGSIAAPTASLHFTKNLMSKIKERGNKIAFVTLHVNLGTFAPLTEKHLKTKQLHSEYFEIDHKTAQVLNRAKQNHQPIIAVGTTVARTLESSAISSKLNRFSGDTQLFIQPGYKFKFIDGLITNFHVPKSSLLMLVSAFTGRKTLFQLYQRAIAQKFKFFSFGDGMLIL